MPKHDDLKPAWISLQRIGSLVWMAPVMRGGLVRFRMISMGRYDFSRWFMPVALQIARDEMGGDELS